MIVKRFSINDFPEEKVNELLDKIYPNPIFKPATNCESYHEIYFKTWICVFESEKCVGKIALFENPEISDLDPTTLIAGYFDAINSQDVMNLINQTISDFCLENGYQRVIGPLNATTWDTYRFLQDGNANPFFLDVNHPNYYHDLWQQSGWQSSDTYHSTEGEIKDIAGDLDPKVKFHLNEIEIKPFDLSRFEDEIRSIYEMCLISFKNNRYYSPISFSDFLSKYQKVKSVINPEFVLLAKHHSKTVGFIFSVPDILYPDLKRLIIKTLAILPNPEYKGLGSYLTRVLYLKAAKSFNKIIHALMYDSNASAKILSKHHQIIQKYTLFEWVIQS